MLTSGFVLLILRVLIALVLFSFLAFGLWLYWQDLRRLGRELSAPPIPALSITQAETDPPQIFRITTQDAILGRDPTCAVRLNDPTISGRHARLAYHHAQWWLEDLHSRNGTWLNGQPVTNAVVLTLGDELRCGGLVFYLTIEKESA